MLASRPLMHTEYLQPLDPLPTTLDAKKSPLALLAQTCSSIGKPDPPPSSNDAKQAATPIGRHTPSGKHSPEKASTAAGLPESSSGFKPYKQAEKRDGDALVIKIGYGKDKREAKSPLGSNSPRSPLVKTKMEPATTPTSRPGSTDASTGHSGSEGNKDTTTVSKPTAPVQAAQVAPSHLHHSSYPGHYKHGLLAASHAGHCGCPSQVVGHVPYYPDPAVAARDPVSVHSLKHEVNPLLAATASPYTAYARVKTADGGTTLMPICRDPYCTNCQSAQHYQTGTPSGCTQCRHDTFALNAPLPIALPLPGSMSPYLSSSVSSSVHSTPYLYPHPITTTSQEHGHVCNWVSGATSCGKRFASSEELLQHLRTHTMTNSEVPTSSALSATLGAQLSAYYMQYPTAAAAAAAAASFGLPKPGFPTPLSPVGAIRYHPYSKSPSPIAALPGLPTGAYYSPYALHDIKSRFATAGLPH
ncbi:zinc finger protein 703-like [Patiria miniata]|uniref:C2H2-type domain-containing protein n=1 Tax=Patiria miniata TaxID=46514 RepID=A0A914ADG4_PATMI|nr:zinc finger protein 703-like [Patiria miniata]